jgi:hypothetical protein
LRTIKKIALILLMLFSAVLFASPPFIDSKALGRALLEDVRNSTPATRKALEIERHKVQVELLIANAAVLGVFGFSAFWLWKLSRKKAEADPHPQ